MRPETAVPNKLISPLGKDIPVTRIFEGHPRQLHCYQTDRTSIRRVLDAVDRLAIGKSHYSSATAFRTQRHPLARFATVLDHRQRRFGFRRAGRVCRLGVDDQRVLVLYEGMAEEGELALLPAYLPEQPGVEIGVDAWVSFERFSARNSTRLCARPAGSSDPSLRRKLFIAAGASISAASTDTWSVDSSRLTLARPISAARNSRATSASSRRSRFLEKVEASHTPESISSPMNPRNRGRTRSAPSTCAPSAP